MTVCNLFKFCKDLFLNLMEYSFMVISILDLLRMEEGMVSGSKYSLKISIILGTLEMISSMEKGSTSGIKISTF